MANLKSVQQYGEQLLVIFDDGTRQLAYPTVGGLWINNSYVAPPPPPPSPPSISRFVWPFNPARWADGGAVEDDTSEYGPRWGRIHQGIDFSGYQAPDSAEIPAAGGGYAMQRHNSGFGNHIIIDHGDNIYTVYGHMWSFLVDDGEQVSQGQPIGILGNTGNSFGSHCHFETHIGGLNWENPGYEEGGPGTHLNPRHFMAMYGQ